MFQFYRYDGTQFFMDEGIPVPERTRSQFLNGMGDGIHMSFSFPAHNAEFEPLE